MTHAPLKRFLLGTYPISAGGDGEAFHRENALEVAALRSGAYSKLISLDGGREERADMRAYCHQFAAATGVRIHDGGSFIRLGDQP